MMRKNYKRVAKRFVNGQLQQDKAKGQRQRMLLEGQTKKMKTA